MFASAKCFSAKRHGAKRVMTIVLNPPIVADFLFLAGNEFTFADYIFSLEKVALPEVPRQSGK